MPRAIATFANAAFSIRSALSTEMFRRTACGVAVLIGLFAFLSLNVGTRRVESRTAVTVHAEGRGKPFLNLQDGRQMFVTFRGGDTATQALQSGQAAPRALASTDFDKDGAPDVVTGYAAGQTGIVTIQRGNPDAFAPQDDSVYMRIHDGYNPEALLPKADTYVVPAPVDLVQTGDFNHDGMKDVLTAARGGSSLFLLAGDGHGGLEAPEQIAVDGIVRAMSAGEFRAVDGFTDFAVAVDTASGSKLEVFDGAPNAVDSPMSFLLSGPASRVEFKGMDNDPFQDIVVLAGQEVDIIHGWSRKQTVNANSQVEPINLRAEAKDIAIGQYIWNRAGQDQMAVLFDDGTINIWDRSSSDTRPYTEAELETRQAQGRGHKTGDPIDVELLPGWQPGKSERWGKARSMNVSPTVSERALSQDVLKTTHIAPRETDELLVLDGSQNKLNVIRQNTLESSPSQGKAKQGIQTDAVSSEFAAVSLDTNSAPTAILELPRKVNGEKSLVVTQGQSSAPSIVPSPPLAIVVDRTDDPDPATIPTPCTGVANDCSLRLATQVANLAANAGSTISFLAASGTYILNRNGTAATGCEGNSVGDLAMNQDMTITGNGSANTIIVQHGQGALVSSVRRGDRVICLNETVANNRTYSFSGVTIKGGRDSSTWTAGGIIGGGHGNALTLTNVVLVNNQASSATTINSGGGGLQIVGGSLTITGSTIGGNNIPDTFDPTTTANRDSDSGNLAAVTGGGINWDPTAGAAQTANLTVTTTTFKNNKSTSTTGGGGGLDVNNAVFGSSTAGSGVATLDNCTFTSNVADNGAGSGNGGGLLIESLSATVNGTSGATAFDSNTAGNGGGGIFASGSLNLTGGGSAITFSSNNAAVNKGSSIMVNGGTTTLSGNNITIGGDIVVATNGFWVSAAGAVFAPNNFLVLGGTMTCNSSTMNVSNDFTLGHEAAKGFTFNGNSATINIAHNLSVDTNNGGSGALGSFTAGTSTFNFNGSAAQSIANSGTGTPITFFNLTDSNTTNPLTVSNSLNVGGTLTVNANAIFAPVDTAVIGGAGTLTGSGTARVTRTAVTADFLSQYAITNKTLTNLTVEYIGAAAQVLSAITYGPLKINNGSGVTLAAGTSTVNGLLTLTSGALGVGNQILVINNGSSVGAGSITSNPTGTVNYNQSSVGQNVRAFNYGNLTFSNFNKVLEPSGTIGISGVFNPGTAVGHTITGSTIDFNGTGAQSLPAFNFNNLTISGARTTNSVTLVSGGTIGIAGSFSPTASFTSGNYIVTNNTINYNGSGLQTIAAFNYFNLTSSNVGGRILANGGTIGIANVFTIGGNTYTITGSTVNFNGTGAQTIPAFNFNNLTISGARGANNVTLANGGTIGIAGAFSPTATFGGGNYVVTNNTIDYNGSGAQTISAFNYNNLTISGARGANNVTLVNGGTIGIAGVFNPTASFGGGNYVVTNNTVDFNGAGAQTIPAFNYFNLTSSNVGSRTLANSGSIGIAGVFTPGTNAYTIAGSTVVYNGSSPQTLPVGFTTYNNLTLNNAAGVTGFAGLTVNGLLRVQLGTFTSSSIYNDVQIDAGATLAGTNATTINVGGNWTNNGTFTANNNTVNFNGSGAQVIGGSSATTFNNLTIANAGSGVSLGQNATVNGVLTLTNDLNTGANTLTMPASGSSTGTGDVIGNVKRTGFVSGGAALSFGNLNNQIKINSGTAPTDITINLVKAAPSGGIAFPSAVQRTYTITPTGGSGITATLRLHYLDAELNSNSEGALGLWRHDGTAWSRQGATAADSSNPANWVELNSVTQFSPWTLSSAKNDSITTITADTPDPSVVGQAVPINFSVVSNVTGAPTPTGSVTITVNDVSGDTCSGSLSGGTGTCNLTLTTVGSKTLTATYNADSNFNGSTDTEAHEVVTATVAINNASVAEPTSGTTNMVFTVSLSGPAAGTESVDFATADQSPGAGHALAGTCGNPGADYVTTTGTVSFSAGQQVKTISVPVCSDADNSETDETFVVNLSNPQGGVVINVNQAVGTITVANPAGTLVISELRTRGPGGANDEFVELYNNTDSAIVVPVGGYGVFKMGADCSATPVLLGTVPAATNIPARSHYLMVGSAYSLGDYGGTGAAAGNLTMGSDIEDDHNVAVFSTANVASISSTNRLDAVGFGTNTGGVCDLMREGSTLAPVGAMNIEYSYFRTLFAGNPKDTNDNLADFKFADTQGTFIAGIPQALGAPGPENLTSPLRRDTAGILLPLLDTTLSSSSAPNRFRDFVPAPPTAPNGTLQVRRRIQNNTGATVTRLRFRIVDITTFPSPGVGTADLRVITSSPVVISGINDAATCASTGTPTSVPCQVTAQSTVLETPPSQPNGGGYNSTVTVAIPGGLANGASINVNFALGVVQGGSFRFKLIIEALP